MLISELGPSITGEAPASQDVEVVLGVKVVSVVLRAGKASVDVAKVFIAHPAKQVRGQWLLSRCGDSCVERPIEIAEIVEVVDASRIAGRSGLSNGQRCGQCGQHSEDDELFCHVRSVESK